MNSRLHDPDATLMTADNFVGDRSFNHYIDWAKGAQEAGHTWWFRGVPVTRSLHEFLCAIRAKRFDVLASIESMPVHMENPSGDAYRAYNKVGIVFPDLPTHRIGLAFIDNGSFCVKSEKIENEKFSVNSEGYRIRKSKDMKKMLKVALQYFKPLQFDAVYASFESDLTMAVHNVRSPAQEKLRDALTMGTDSLMTEAQNMLALGYAPVTLAFQNALKLLAEEGSELKRLRNYKPRACFVWAKQNSLVYRYNDSSEAVEVTNLADLPEDINNKLAVLNIAEQGSTVPDVGIRLNPYAFWVFI